MNKCMRLIWFFLLIVGVEAQAAKCSDSSGIKFTWEWCSANPALQTPVKRTCFGEVLYTDLIYRAIEVEIAKIDGSSDFECIFDSGNWKDVVVEGCPRAIEREYISAFGEPLVATVTECQVDGTVESISGKTLNGHSYSSKRPTPQQ